MIFHFLSLFFLSDMILRLFFHYLLFTIFIIIFIFAAFHDIFHLPRLHFLMPTPALFMRHFILDISDIFFFIDYFHGLF